MQAPRADALKIGTKIGTDKLCTVSGLNASVNKMQKHVFPSAKLEGKMFTRVGT